MIEKTYSFTRGGETVDVYTLKNKSGMEMDVMTFGGRILRLTAVSYTHLRKTPLRQRLPAEAAISPNT